MSDRTEEPNTLDLPDRTGQRVRRAPREDLTTDALDTQLMERVLTGLRELPED
jgi:hypothetical protein